MAAPALWDNNIGVKGSFDEITLGADQYFVLGDNRKSCEDSRLWGTFSKKDIKAKALFCYFPFNKFKLCSILNLQSLNVRTIKPQFSINNKLLFKNILIYFN